MLALVGVVGSATTQETPPGSDEAVSEPLLAERKRLYGLAFDHWMDQIIRLQDVAQRLKIAGRDVCGKDVSPVWGVVAIAADAVPEVFESVAKERFGEAEGRRVIAVFPGTAADRAGLQVGDVVLEVDDSNEREPIRVEINRVGEHLKLDVEPVLGCADPVRLVGQEEVNAWADGSTISVTTALMRAYPDDAMLAQIVGHELAHNINSDARKFRRQSFKRRQREALADYVGVYLAAMAGYPIATDTELILGLQREIQSFGEHGSHPTTAARDLALRKTLEEIRGKQERGEAIDLGSQ
jgi:hypothetical protein